MGATLKVVLALVALAFVACDKDKPTSTSTATSTATSTSTSTSTATATSTAISTATSTSTADAPARAACPYAGTWESKYDAKKGSVGVPSSQKDVVRATDDGKLAMGAGTVTLTIALDGEITGKVEGALGPGTISGSVDEMTVRATIFPDERGAAAMAGILFATEAGGAMKGDIRVSGPDASVVRTATVELKKK